MNGNIRAHGSSTMIGSEALTDFPTAGDNFRTVGPWRILKGEGWRRWQGWAIAAEIAASEQRGDMISRARLVLELQARKAENPGRRTRPRQDGDSTDLIPSLGTGHGGTGHGAGSEEFLSTEQPSAARASDG